MPEILCKNTGKDTPIILVGVWVSVDSNILSTANPFSLSIQCVQQVNSPASTREAPILYFYGFLPECAYNNSSIALFDQTNQLLRLVNTIKTIPNTIHHPLLNDHRALWPIKWKVLERLKLNKTDRWLDEMTFSFPKKRLSPKRQDQIELRRKIIGMLKEIMDPLVRVSVRRIREIERFILARKASIWCFYEFIN